MKGISRIERCVDRIAMSTTKLHICAAGDEQMQVDDEDTMMYQMQRFVTYGDARSLAIKTAESVHVLHDWFFTWSGAMNFVKKQKSVDRSTSTVMDVSMRKLPFFGYVVIRTML